NPTMPHVFWDDAAVTRGDGIFETILVRDGKAVNLDKHMKRFRASAAARDLPEPREQQWISATREAVADFVRERGLQPGDPSEAACTWTMTRGRESTGVPTAWITVRPPKPELEVQRRKGVKVLTTGRGYTIDTGRGAAPWLGQGAKTLNYSATMAALRWAKSQGCDDVIYIEPATGRVLEGATSSVLVVKRGTRLRTPEPGPDILSGTTQRAVFDYASAHGWKCKAKSLYVDDLYSAESVWLLSSVRRGVRVTHIDGKKLNKPDNLDEIAALIDASLNAADS
ncbi:aminodeoxychorismate lyase, partial [Corynebacterium sp.]|uniref:aminodeoxychorismate lyase n=1 Tax=Corynebacterium sp. TaxID=1720 RepID=UPI002A91F3AF